ncbi:hypothetical protein RZS08_40975, partial [Arthrospira platensis SPKY1]|nr:hypothetical protein [Arthrospira platensis SPKY1]
MAALQAGGYCFPGQLGRHTLTGPPPRVRHASTGVRQALECCLHAAAVSRPQVMVTEHRVPLVGEDVRLQ